MLYKTYKNIVERRNLPLNGPGNYRVREGIIYTRAIEINAVRQCNLSCKGCSHSSPIAARQELNPSDIFEDLFHISNFLKCMIVRIVGGEPLLHSNLKELICEIKRSGISKEICLVTNGILLNMVDQETLSYVDQIEISLYPFSEIMTEKIREIARKLHKTGIKVQILEYDKFRVSRSRLSSDDEIVTNLVYRTCQIAHVWRCLTVDHGRLYRCPQSMIFSEEMQDYSSAIKINDISDMEEILTFLEDNSPFQACRCCLGSVGTLFHHEQIRRDSWKESLPLKQVEALDYEYAKKLCEYAHTDNDCMRRIKFI